MTEQHTVSEHLALYLRGLLDGVTQREVEEHVSACDECADRLRMEARLELSLHRMFDGSEAVPLPARSRRTKVVAVALGLAAAAAAIFLILWTVKGPRPVVARDERTSDMNARQAVVGSLLAVASATPVVGCSAEVGDTTPAHKQPELLGLEGLPQGWIRAGSAPNAYSMGLDPASTHAGNAALALASKPDATLTADEFGTVMTTTDAAPYRGKRVRIHGFVRAASVTGWAGLWMRVDGPPGTQPLAFDNMQSRPICATSSWTAYDVVLEVDVTATKIAFGALLEGQGSIWFEPLKLEVVDASVATTSKGGVSNRFEAAATRGLAPKWFLNGSAVSSYVAGADTAVHHGGSSSVSVASTAAVPDGKFGGAMQNTVVLDAYRGSRLRLSAYIKTQDVRGWAGLWMRIDGLTGSKPLAFDNMEDRPIKGSTDWAQYTVVLDVPAEARNVALGVLLAGEGHVWMDDVVLEPVGH